MAGIKVAIWNDDRTKTEVLKRYKNAARARTIMEERWGRNERTIYSTSALSQSNLFQYQLDYSITEAISTGVDQSNANMNVSYAFKNFRFIHAQMSANPPSVAMRPTNSDQENHRKADAADRIVRWSVRHYQLQEEMDQMNFQALLYGTGIIKTVWDSTKGAILKEDDEGNIELEGDIDITVPFIWNFYIDPDAKKWKDAKWTIERIYMDYDEALARWPDKEKELKSCRIEDNQNSEVNTRQSQIRDMHYNAVQLMEYWETGLPTNGYLGRYCITTINGDVIEGCRPSPFRFKKAGAVYAIENNQEMSDEQKEELIDKLPEQASLPYVMLTDVDVANLVWGMASIEYCAQLQDTLSRLDSSIIDNIQAHGMARMILPETADIDEDALSDSPWDVVKITGNQPPYFMQAPSLMPEMSSTRANLIQGINDVMGVNDSMFGQQSREQSSASMQYATNQGNMIRRRLFNKYVLAVEMLYNNILNLVRKHWSINRTIHVLGKEKALESIDIKGSDIDGGYDVVGEYGVTLSLDPITRREEIITLQPLFEKAGVPVRKSLEMLKLNELEGMYDSLDLAGNRQKEIFDEMIADGIYIPPKKYRDHENMIAWALDYFMTQEFENLPENIQQLCEQHIADRATLAAQEKSGPVAAAQPAATPGPAPAGPAGAPPAPAGGPPIQNG